MPIDPKIQRLMMMIEARGEGGSPRDIEARRASFRSLMGLSKPEGKDCAVATRRLPTRGGAVPLRIYTHGAAAPGALPGLIYLHGGGMVAGDLDTHDALCRTFCAAIGGRVLGIDYRLAPEHRFPAAIEDCLAATRFILEQAADLGLDPARIAIAGDSAGGTLAAVVTQTLAPERSGTLCAQFLLCPVLDAAGNSPSRRAFARGYLLDDSLMQRDLDDYLRGGEDLADPRLSPLRAPDLSGLPPAYIHIAEFDPLRDEGAAYAARLESAGVPVRWVCHAGMVHHFYGFAALAPKARDALRAIGAEMGAVLAGRSGSAATEFR